MIIIKTVLITGATGGIGQALTLAFARAGYNVVCQFNKNSNAAVLLEDDLNDIGANSLFIQADISDPDEVETMFEDAIDEFGQIDVLVNNAGIALQKLFTDTTDDDWQQIMGVDLNGTFYCCKNALKSMIRNHEGNIINISSMWGQVGASCEVAYSAAKAGVIGLTKALAKEVGPSNINVNCIAPGVIQTPMLNSFSEDDLDNLKDETPLCRLGTPEDIANMALFLASDKASFITGQVFGVNGGFVI